MTDYLKLAKEAFHASTTWFDSNYRERVENNIRMFHSQHPRNSKYNTDLYKYRSRLFIPKTRAVIRKNEAAISAAYFSNVDVADVKPQDESDEYQMASAAINKELLQYRLTKTLPWFKILNGAFQEAQVVGAVISKQTWEYEEKETTETHIDEFGEEAEVKVTQVIKDQPKIDLVPLENFRFDPAADWLDPINSSPYNIHMIPMYLSDFKNIMDGDEKTGRPKFKKVSDDELRLAMSEDSTSGTSIRIDREKGNEDPKSNDSSLGDYEIIWIHENIIREKGADKIFYTLGTHMMISEVQSLEDVYFHGERPFAMGISVIEAHRAMPDSLSEIGADLQKMSNELANSRMDNVRLVMNKRYMVKRGAQVDIQSLHRNVAGGVTMVNAHDDVVESEFQDVTQSSYLEQDRINSSYDELVGNFSSGSAQQTQVSNAASDTLGGLGIVSANASLLTDYLIRTFNETWVEPVMYQLIRLEQKYESDKTVLAIAADKSQLYQKYGIDKITDDLLDQSLTLSVNVGIGATDPNTRLQKLIYGINALTTIAMNPPPNADLKAISDEIFANLGYKNGSQFFKDEEDVDPMVMQLQQQVQQLTQIIQSKQLEQQAKLESDKLKVVGSLEKQKMADEADMVMQEKDLAFKQQELTSKNFVELEKIDAAG